MLPLDPKLISCSGWFWTKCSCLKLNAAEMDRGKVPTLDSGKVPTLDRGAVCIFATFSLYHYYIQPNLDRGRVCTGCSNSI